MAFFGDFQPKIYVSPVLHMKFCSLSLLLLFALSGCAPGQGGAGSAAPPTPDPNYKFMTGNWKFTAVPTTKAAPFTELAGFINEQSDEPSINDYTTAALQANSSNCFGQPPDLSLTGSAQGTAVTLSSFPTDSQVVTITGTKDATSTHLTGNYEVVGGCADGSTGTLTGSLYQPLNGTYNGQTSSTNPAASVQFLLSQAPQGDGEGRSFLTGSAVFQNIPCFSSGTVVGSSSFVLGSSTTININTNDPNGSKLLAAGSFDASADTINLTSAEIIGGSCSGALGPIALTLDK